MIWSTMSRGRTRLGLAAWGITLVAIAMLVAVPAEAQRPKLSVAVGQSITQKMPTVIKTISIANTDVADVVVAGPREILINGKAVGYTTLVVWDENNVSTTFNVVVRGPFSDQQIELRVRVAELDRTKSLEYGMDWLWSNDRWMVASFGGEVATPRIPHEVFNGQPSENVSMALRYMFGDTDVISTIKALQEDGFVRVLAEPNVVAASGEEANFLSGGEFPVPVVSAGTQGGSTVTIEWKEFGVSVEFLPTIVDSGVISLRVAPEVSRLDFENGVLLSGFRVPAIDIRKAETTVELEDGQVLVIGGLMLESEISVVRRIPILGHIPLVGPLFFSNTVKEDTTQELLIVVSTHLIRALPKGTRVTLPGENESH